MALNRETSKESTAHLVGAILGLEDFKQDIHQATMETRRASGMGEKEVAYKKVREKMEEKYTSDQKQGLDYTLKGLNHWILVVSCMTNNSVLSKDEFRDMIL
eukprot:7174276-Ditylum_brightwellii.AAC.1